MKENTCRKKQNTKRYAWPIVASILLIVGFLARYGAAWYNAHYDSVGFDAVLYTITADLNGTDPELLQSCMLYLAQGIPLLALLLVLFFYKGNRTVSTGTGKQIWPFSDKLAVILPICISVLLLSEAAVRVELPAYIWGCIFPSQLYEEEYWHPEDVTIEFPEEKRNLIYIFLESMETTLFSREEGGAMEENLIPELYQLAEEHVNFSHRDGVGGFTAAPGTTWTSGGIVGQSAGIPLKTPLGMNKNAYGINEAFLPGVQSLGSILTGAGYNQAAMFGSNGYFGGRLPYYTSHGNCVVYDLAQAWDAGIVPDGFHNGFWGIDDKTLYDYARVVLTDMAAEDAPFAFTMLTVDTHFPDGYVCQLCEETYPRQYDNVYRCASKQVADFLDWLEAQDFYENTTIVIAGDHLTMAGDYFGDSDLGEPERKVYNCFINAAAEPVREKNREISTFDMFPTTLAAMGCKVVGDRLALGTNLFSDTPTLMEQYGSEAFMWEVSRDSEFYMNNFY